ncbi:DUF6894 family protein [uncultured Sphingomonas sp.]|uniref:DUF6894 family protein n=1 Tax=uncultured Sphingomonas sp. TaxID=158754 RepID=UPI0035CC9871
MAHYFLHLRDHTDELLDPDGLELANMGAVKKAVLEGARDVIASDIKEEGVMDLRYRIEAENDAGQVVHCLTFKSAVHVIPEAA